MIAAYERNLDHALLELRKWLLDEDRIDKLLFDVKKMLIKKNHDYGVNNLLKFGLFGILVRLSDKVERAKNLFETRAEVEDETIRDTFEDMAGYGIQAILIHDRKIK